MKKSFPVSKGSPYALLAIVAVLMVVVVAVDAKKSPEPNVFWLETYVHTVEGRCLSHDGEHHILFLKDKEGTLWGSVPSSFAKAGEEILVLKDARGKRWLKKVDDQKRYDPPPE